MCQLRIVESGISGCMEAFSSMVGQAAVGDQVNVKYDSGEKILMTVKVLNPT